MVAPNLQVYDGMETALSRAQAMVRAGYPAEHVGAQLVEGFGRNMVDHLRFFVEHTPEVEAYWPPARQFKRLLLSPGADPADVADLAQDLLESIKTARGVRAFAEALPRHGRSAAHSLEWMEEVLPGVVGTLLLARRGIRPVDVANAQQRGHDRSARSAMGDALTDKLKLERPSWWQRLFMSRERQMATALHVVRDHPLDEHSRRLLADGRRRSWVTEAPATFDVLQWVEAHLPGTTGALSLSAVIDKYEQQRAFRDAVQRISADEHRYARGLGLTEHFTPLQRRALGDVAVAAAYHRVIAHGDPFAIYDQTIAAVGPTHARMVATSIEVAAVDRLTRLLLEPTVKGGLPTVAIGASLDDRVRDALLEAWKHNTLREEVERHIARLGANDPEARRIESVAARIYEADLLLHAIAELRPVAAGLRDEPDRRLAARAIAVQVFIEDDPRDPPRTSDGEILSWRGMLERHPAVGTAAAAAEPCSIALPVPQAAELG